MDLENFKVMYVFSISTVISTYYHKSSQVLLASAAYNASQVRVLASTIFLIYRSDVEPAASDRDSQVGSAVR